MRCLRVRNKPHLIQSNASRTISATRKENACTKQAVDGRSGPDPRLRCAMAAPHGSTTLPKWLHVPPTRAGARPHKVLWTRCSSQLHGFTNNAAALQPCSTQPCAVLYQTMMPGMEMRIYALVLLFAAAVGIKGDITEAAAGAEAIFYLVKNHNKFKQY